MINTAEVIGQSSRLSRWTAKKTEIKISVVMKPLSHRHMAACKNTPYLLDVGDAGQGGALENLRSCEGPKVLLGDVLVGEGDVTRRHEQEGPGGDDEAHG